tara:strand:+ start:96 stop:470 length:375 start_codon:yes stop_codon:yes gene_type:complete
MTKKKKVIKTQFSGKQYQSSGYKKKMGKSLTLPDQNLTIGELLDRHSRGVSLGAVDKQGEYFDTEVPRFNDLTEMLEYKKDLEQKRKDLTKQINAEIEASKQQKPVVEDTEAEKPSEKEKEVEK